MKENTMQNFSELISELQPAKELKIITQSRSRKGSVTLSDTASGSLAERIRQSQNGDTKATLEIIRMLNPLLEREAARMTEQNLFSEKEDAKSEAVTTLLEFIGFFSDFDADNSRIAGLIKKYLHDTRINRVKAAERHCPECYYVDFEKELEENSAFAKSFPCCEMQAEHYLEQKFTKLALLESMQILSAKEETVLKKIIIENKPPSSVAKELRCSTRYLRKIRQHALSKMRLYLETHYPSLCEK